MSNDAYNRELQHLLSCVDGFTKVMKLKLEEKLAQGYRGWNDVEFLPVLKQKLLEHAAKLYSGDGHQAADLANLAMFLFYMLGT